MLHKVKEAPLKYFFLLLALLALINVWLAFVPVPALGDGKIIALIMAGENVFPAAKYLIGMGMLRAGYHIVEHVPGLLQLLPADAPGQIGFVRAAGIFATLASSLILLKLGQGRLRVILALTTPIWLLFSIGYIEYYPCIAGLFLGFLYWIFAQPLASRPAFLVGAVGAILPLLYAGFAPFVAIALLFYWYDAKWRQRFVATAAGCGAFVMAILLFWHKGLSSFFGVLMQDLNLGEKNTVYAAYQGLAAGPHSIFFSLHHVFSMQHLHDVLLMVFCGLGIAGICVLPWAAGKMLTDRGSDRQHALAASIAGWSIAYLLLMMPKLGPMQDLDLFFSSYLALAFVAGMQLERCSQRTRTMLLLVWFASSAVSTAYLFMLAG